MKKYLMMGVAAVTLASCSHDLDLYDQGAVDNLVVEKYKQAFIKNFGQPAPDQDWGFGSTTRGVTRATPTWDGAHSDDWFDKLNFTVPSTATKVTTGGTALANGTYYITKDFTGTLKLADNFVGNLYVETEITNYEGNISDLNLYILKDGSWKCDLRTGSTTIYNRGYLYFDNEGLKTASKVPVVYNGGTLTLQGNQYNNPNIADAVAIYSNGTGLVEINCTKDGEWDYVDLKCTLDIHGTLKVNGKLKIQNSKAQYVCGLEVTGTLDITQGKLESSYIKADNIKWDGAQLWLLAGGHVVTNKITIPNGGCYVYGVEGSNGLIEVGDVVFQNDNDFDRTFSDNIFFKVTGTIDCSGATNLPKGDASKKKYNNAGQYLTQIGSPADRLNAGNATGAPACGQAWSVGTPDPDPTPTPPTPNDELEGYTFLCRVFAEDLSAEEKGDFDFNDVVFDVYTNSSNEAKIVIRAAGGTLPLKVNGYEVHEACGVSVSTMINTKNPDYNYKVVLPGTVSGISSKADVNSNIAVEVDKNGWCILEAVTGEPAAKVAVDEKIDWCTERSDLKEKYPKFVDYVANPSNARWW